MPTPEAMDSLDLMARQMEKFHADLKKHKDIPGSPLYFVAANLEDFLFNNSLANYRALRQSVFYVMDCRPYSPCGFLGPEESDMLAALEDLLADTL